MFCAGPDFAGAQRFCLMRRAPRGCLPLVLGSARRGGPVLLFRVGLCLPRFRTHFLHRDVGHIKGSVISKLSRVLCGFRRLIRSDFHGSVDGLGCRRADFRVRCLRRQARRARCRRNECQPKALSAATPAPRPTAAVVRADGVGIRVRSGTGRLKVSTGHWFSAARRRSCRSGFTAAGCPTAASIGTSVTESEYA